MGGFFGIASKRDCVLEVFFGTDYHSHLGTRRAGMAAFDSEIGMQRTIHNIENSPFRTKFDHVLEDMHGTSAIGSISDSDGFIPRARTVEIFSCVSSVLPKLKQVTKGNVRLNQITSRNDLVS